MDRNIEIRNAFNKSAEDYEQYAVIQQEIGTRLLSRLDYIKIEPRTILDLGAGPGLFSEALKKKYRHAQVVSLDISLSMLQMTQQRQHWWRKWDCVNANMIQMPFASGTFDLVFANQTIHWYQPAIQVLQEIHRVMRSNACFMFTTLGPDTFSEIASAWAQVDNYAHINTFIDMHDWGDALMQAQFLDPVVDQEKLTCHYTSVSQLLKSLKKQGVRNIHAQRKEGLTGKQAYQNFQQAYVQFQTPQGKFPLTYEVVYGHAWRGNVMSRSVGNEVYVDVKSLRDSHQQMKKSEE